MARGEVNSGAFSIAEGDCRLETEAGDGAGYCKLSEQSHLCNIQKYNNKNKKSLEREAIRVTELHFKILV